MRLSIRQLEYFVATCDAGSVTEAAKQIPVSQSSVSEAISQLERVVGVPLLTRLHGQGVAPTPAGRQFLPRARTLLHDAEKLERFAFELSEELSGPLELGCFVPVAAMLTPGLCREFESLHPNVTVEQVEASQEEVMDGLRAGRMSLALTFDFGLEDDISFEPLAELPPFATLPAHHPFADRGEVTLEELSVEPFIMLDLPVSRDYLRLLFMERGLEPRIVHHSPHPEVIRTLVANGFGFTIVNARPQIAASLDGGPLRTVRIAGSPRPVQLGVARLGSTRLTRAAEAFHEHCRKRITQQSIPGMRVPGD
jgi:DNA-binding transcriptional LysR family regulator